jgi:hypothetical protein
MGFREGAWWNGVSREGEPGGGHNFIYEEGLYFGFVGAVVRVAECLALGRGVGGRVAWGGKMGPGEG